MIRIEGEKRTQFSNCKHVVPTNSNSVGYFLVFCYDGLTPQSYDCGSIILVAVMLRERLIMSLTIAIEQIKYDGGKHCPRYESYRLDFPRWLDDFDSIFLRPYLRQCST